MLELRLVLICIILVNKVQTCLIVLLVRFNLSRKAQICRILLGLQVLDGNEFVFGLSFAKGVAGGLLLDAEAVLRLLVALPSLFYLVSNFKVKVLAVDLARVVIEELLLEVVVALVVGSLALILVSVEVLILTQTAFRMLASHLNQRFQVPPRIVQFFHAFVLVMKFLAVLNRLLVSFKLLVVDFVELKGEEVYFVISVVI